ncbi:cation:proton antiporter [Kitasatospora purpeofusca]|uniref:cation:proton antiporter n=1 Tax=Kitasatospora purpeofusca TaxID=67352 RepID=UPI0036C2BE0C
MTGPQAQGFFTALAAVLLLAHTLGWIARRLGQPAVVGEITAGILAGPTLLDGALARHLFPDATGPYLSGLANLGLALFMFRTGRELDPGLLRGRRTTAATVSLASVALPFALGVLLALHLAPRHTTTNKTAFVLFLGAAMAVTAFPVLARILTDHHLHETPTGALALAAAAIDDVIAWTLLAALNLTAHHTSLWQFLFAPLFILAMRHGIRPILPKVLAALPPGAHLAALLCGLFASCWAAERSGLHFVFGAFLFGTATRRALPPVAAPDPVGPLAGINHILFLPAFFITAGLGVDLSGTDWTQAGELALILLAAVTGKFVGAYTGARLTNTPHHQSAVLATLMNTRGLTEIVVLTIGLQIRIIDQSLYSLMVVMALTATAMTSPLLRVFATPTTRL